MDVFPIPGFSEPISSLSHLIAAGVALYGGLFLFREGKGNKTRFFSLFIFTFALVFLFSMSGVYHLLEPGNVPREVFRRLDHAAIWVLIAGTFTPIHTLLFRGIWRTGFLFFIWAIAITGLVLEVVFFGSVPEWLSLTFYLSLGWMGVISGIKYAMDYGPGGAKLLVAGGLAYSIGAIFEFLRWPTLADGIFGPHELFHMFIILAAGFHWWFIHQRAGHPIINKLIVDVIEYPNSKFYAKTRGERIELTADSLEELQLKIHAEVEKRFPKYVRPKNMVLKFSKEAIVPL